MGTNVAFFKQIFKGLTGRSQSSHNVIQNSEARSAGRLSSQPERLRNSFHVG